MKRKMILSLCLAGCVAFAVPAVTYAESEKTKEKKAAKLSKDLYSFSAKIGEEIYSFPMTYAEFMEKGGWEVTDYYKDQEEDMLSSNSYTYLGLEKDGNEITAYIINYDINETAMADCYVGGIQIDTGSNFDPEALEAVLPGGIKVGSSSMKAIKKAYGMPSDTYEGEDYTKLTYEKDSNRYVEFCVYKESEVLETAEIRSFVAPEDFVFGKVSEEIPEIVANYKEPEALSGDYTDPIVEYFGDLYQLPAPIGAFIANGWVLEGVKDGDYVPGDGLVSVDMSKENQNVHVYLYNDTQNAVLYENCMVHELGFYTSNNPAINMKLSGGVTLGADGDELMAAAKENGYYVEDEMEDGYLTVAKSEDIKYDNYVEFWIDTEEDEAAIAGFSIHCEKAAE